MNQGYEMNMANLYRKTAAVNLKSAADPTRTDRQAMIKRGAEILAAQKSTCKICGQCKSERAAREQLAAEFGVDESDLHSIIIAAGTIYAERRRLRKAVA
jgi:hypothetical protein